MANILDGVFTTTNGVLQIIQAPALTRKLYQQFYRLVGQAKRGAISADRLEKEAEKLDPNFGAAVRAARMSPHWIVVLILVLAALKSCSFNLDATVDVNQLIEHILAAQRIETLPDREDAHGHHGDDGGKATDINSSQKE